MFKGIGDPWIRTTAFSGTSPNDQRMMVLGLLSFELTAESNSKESQKFNSEGTLVTASKVKGSTSYSFTLSYNEIDWGNLGFALNQFPRSATAATIPTLKYGTVPTTAPYTITDTGISATNVSVVITKSGTWGQAGQALTVGGTGAGTVAVSSTTLTFNAAQAGASVAYLAYASSTFNAQDYGGPTGGKTWGKFEFWGTIFIPSLTSGTKIYIPEASISEDPTITIDDGVPTVEVVCGMTTPSGWDKPFRIFNLDTATV